MVPRNPLLVEVHVTLLKSIELQGYASAEGSGPIYLHHNQGKKPFYQVKGISSTAFLTPEYILSYGPCSHFGTRKGKSALKLAYVGKTIVGKGPTQQTKSRKTDREREGEGDGSRRTHGREG